MHGWAGESRFVHATKCPHFPLGVFRRRAGTKQSYDTTLTPFEDLSGSPLTDKNQRFDALNTLRNLLIRRHLGCSCVMPQPPPCVCWKNAHQLCRILQQGAFQQELINEARTLRSAIQLRV